MAAKFRADHRLFSRTLGETREGGHLYVALIGLADAQVDLEFRAQSGECIPAVLVSGLGIRQAP
jgi:hypothetical protein